MISILLFYLQKIKKLNTPAEVIKFSLSRYRKEIFLVEPSRNLEIKYEQLEKYMKNIASFLIKKGLRNPDVVGFYSPNSYEYFVVRGGAHLANLVFFPLPHYLGEKEIIYFLRKSETKILFARGNLEKIKEKTKLEEIIDLDKEVFPQIISSQHSSFTFPKISPFHLATLNLSSATTTRIPKIVKLTNKNWMFSLYNYLSASHSLPKNKIIFLSPLSLATAGSTTFLPLLLSGATTIIINEFSPSQLISYIKKYNVNRLYLTSSWFLELLWWCKKENERLNSLESIIIGTERIPPLKLKEAIEFFGPKINVGYGMVEALPPLTMLSPYHYYKKGRLKTKLLESVGKIIKGVKLKVINDCGSFPKIGRIAIKSPTVSSGYLKIEKTKYFKKGWFYSKDYGFIEKNFLYFSGREEDVFHKEENFIFAQNIEDKLYSLSFIKRCAVILKDKGSFIFVSLEEGFDKEKAYNIIDEFYKKNFNKILPLYKILIKEKLPLTPLGKLDRKKLEKEVKNFSFLC